MSTLHFSIDIDGDRELSRKIHGLTRAVSDWSPAFKAMAADWSSTMEQKFSTEGGHEAGTDAEGNPNPPWAPLSARYAAWKARKYPGKGILEATGELREAATLVLGAHP